MFFLLLLFKLKLTDGFASFREAFPEWCEDDSVSNMGTAKTHGASHSEPLMGLR